MCFSSFWVAGTYHRRAEDQLPEGKQNLFYVYPLCCHINYQCFLSSIEALLRSLWYQKECFNLASAWTVATVLHYCGFFGFIAFIPVNYSLSSSWNWWETLGISSGIAHFSIYKIVNHLSVKNISGALLLIIIILVRFWQCKTKNKTTFSFSRSVWLEQV